MKVFIYSTWGIKCGISAYTSFLLEKIRGQGIDADVIPLNGGLSWKDFVAAGLKANDADLVHIQYENSFFGKSFIRSLINYWFMVSRIKVPLVITVHEPFLIKGRSLIHVFKRALAGLLQRMILGPASLIIVHSRFCKDILVNHGINVDKIFVLMHPIPEISPEADRARPKADIINVVIFGFIFARKGYDFIFPVVKKIKGCFLTIAGGQHPKDKTNYIVRLREKIARLGLNDRVRITGYLSEDEIKRVMIGADVVLAPFIDNFGSGSLSFAIAYHKPILASNIAYCCELRETAAGIELFNAQDDNALLEKLRGLLRDSALRHKLSEMNQDYARNYSYSQTAKVVIEKYKSLMSSVKK